MRAVALMRFLPVEVRFVRRCVALLLVLWGTVVHAQTPDFKGLPAKLSPADASKSFEIASDLAWDQVLAEPNVRQPVSFHFDERGRLWVCNYVQYPHPAGLKILSRDIFWRVVYDRVPPPPPNHVRGKDVISIHEDTDGDGTFDKTSTFLDGMNIVTSTVTGRGGLWVLNPPYLVFYPILADGKPGDPVVHLQGFGLEDTHSTANSLRWGPDGWLYASHGSTVSANVTRPGDKAKPIQMIGQHVWRYHPEKKRFEIFAEGGGNAFGVEIDSKGRVFSGHNGGDTRGFHYVQGGYYRKGFEKHGVLANPYAFGFFEAMKHNKAARFTHNLCLYEGAAFPKPYHGKLFGVAPLQGHITFSDVFADRSSVQTKDFDPVVKSKDTWFRPVHLQPAPDGSIFVADFYEAKIAHLNHNDGLVDRETGRIYRLRSKDAKFTKAVDFSKLRSAELVEHLKSENRWQREMALRVLGDRKDASIHSDLKHQLATSRGPLALHYLWALNLSGGLEDAVAEKALTHADASVREWTVRLLGDDLKFGPKLVGKIAELARTETDAHVRSQLACSARRVPAEEGLPVVQALLQRDEDATDIHVPLLLWWAIEARCENQREAVLETFRDSTLWRAKIVEETILSRLMRRFAQAGTQKDYRTCLALFRLAPEAKHGKMLMKGFEEAFKGRSITGLPKDLLDEIGKIGGGSLAFGVRQGNQEAVAKALKTITDTKVAKAERLELIDVFGEAQQPRCVEPLLNLVQSKESDEVRKSALVALQSYNETRVGEAVVKGYPAMKGELREVAETLLASRKSWSDQWLRAVETGVIDAKSIPQFTVRKLLLHRDAKIGELVRKHWGDLKGATTTEMQKDIERLGAVVQEGKGDPYGGKKLFTARCATCHTLHAHGGTVGPDLTPFKRDEPGPLLLHIINPSVEIREGYVNFAVNTTTGRTLSGIVVEKDNQVVVLRIADGQRIILPKDEIDEMGPTGLSLMPEGLLKDLSDQEVRDLFAYLRTSQPLNERK